MILDAARELFLEHGFDAVSVREIADKADVSPTTVFAYFPQKESLAFGDEDERHEQLVAAVVGRARGISISEALRTHFSAGIAAFQSEPRRHVLALMEATPALSEHAEQLWFRHEGALAAAILEEFGLAQPSDEIRFSVRFALQIQLIAIQDGSPEAAVDAGFRFLDEGWSNYHRRAKFGS